MLVGAGSMDGVSMSTSYSMATQTDHGPLRRETEYIWTEVKCPYNITPLLSCKTKPIFSGP
jgi:hypothetical protein